ncbi:unnamed protein product, partial [Adineta steineri]
MYDQFEEHDAYPRSAITTTAQSHSLPAYTTRHDTLFSLGRQHYVPSTSQRTNDLQQFDKMDTDLPWNYKILETDEEKEDDNNNNQELQELDELILSQQLRELSTNTTHNEEVLMKDMKDEIEKIPNFLTKHDNSFKQMLYQAQLLIKSTNTTTTIDIKQLREIAIIIYKIMIIQTYHVLWTVYLKSGRGELIISSETVRIWPKEITSLLKVNNTTNSHEIYLNFVNQHLHALDHQLNICKTELNTKANNICGYSLMVQKIIETYVEKHIQSFRSKTEHQIELIHYDYHIRKLKLEYIRFNPNQYQIEIMKKICQSKYEQETAEQEYNFLKQQIDYYNSPSQSFQHLPLAQAAGIETIQNAEIRQQLLNQYKEVTLQVRDNLFPLYLTTAADQKEEFKKKMNVNDDNNQQLKIKCHGNRRDQRFRRKCRKRGMRPAKIEKLLDKFKYPNEKTRRIEQRMRDLAYYNKQLTAPVFRTSLDQVSNQSSQLTATTTVTTHLNKRKRNISLQELKANSAVPKSTSSISIRQPSSKKAKQQIETTTTMPIIKENNNNILNYVYRQPIYLQRSSWILFQTLSKRLNYSLNDKHKQYIYTRLTILDHIYCLEVHLQLCKSFLEIGRTEHHWPEEVRMLSKTNDYELCFQYFTNYIGQLNEQINLYETELTTQLSSYLMIPISVNQVDTCLKEYVNHQRQYLVTKNSNQLTKLQDEIQANKLYETIMTSYPNLNPNQFIDQLISIRQKQTQILEELLQLEMRIFYKFLPPELDQLEKIVAPITYIPLNNEHKTIELNNKRHKMIQDAKRQWLHISLSVYETKLQEYNHQLESILLNNTSLQGT